jgi:hypothetical protein
MEERQQPSMASREKRRWCFPTSREAMEELDKDFGRGGLLSFATTSP